MAVVEPTRAILYGAKSTKDEHGSIPTQLADGRKLAEREGWEIVAEYSDEDASAYKGNRGDGLARAKAHAASIHGVLIVQHADRLARGDGVSADHLVELALWARKAGVRITSVQDPGTFEGGLAFAAMMGDRNHEDSKRKGAAVKSGMARRRAKGMHSGGPRKYGYESVRDEYGRTVPNEPLRVVPAEAAIVLRLYSEYVSGITQRSTGRALTAEGVPTTRGGEWHQGTIAKYLADPWYAGLVRDGDELASGQHEAIVPRELWEQARVLREAGARSKGGGRGRRPNAGHLFIKGMLRCGRCGGAMVPRSDTRWEPSYYCYRRVRMGVEACAQTPVKRAAIDGAVMAYFEHAVLDMEATRRDIEANVERQASETRALLAQAETDERKATERLERVKGDYLDGKISAADWQEFRDRLTSEHEAATAKVSQLRGQEIKAVDEARANAEEATLRYLSDIRAAVLGTVKDAHGVEAVRAALLRVFEGFTLRRHAEPFDRDVFDNTLMRVGDGFELQPHVRADAIACYGPQGITARPLRVPLNAGNIDAMSLPNAYLFAPIPVAA